MIGLPGECLETVCVELDLLEGFEVELPYISEYKLKEIIEIWLTLYNSDVVSMSTLRNRVPGIDPEAEKRLILSEREESRPSFEVSDIVGEEDDEED